MGILYILAVCGFGAVLDRIVGYWQARSRYLRAQHDGCGRFMGWGEFCKLASAGQGCLIITTLGRSRPMHRWHPQGELSAEELEEAYFDEVAVRDVLPPFWCHGSRWISLDLADDVPEHPCLHCRRGWLPVKDTE